MQRCPAGYQDFESRRGTQQFTDDGSRLTQVLEVVQDQEQLLRPEEVPELFRKELYTLLSHAERSSDGGDQLIGIGNRGKRDKEHPVRRVLEELSGGLQGQPRLAGTSRSGQCQQLDVVTPEQGDYLTHLPLAAKEGGRLARQVMGMGLE